MASTRAAGRVDMATDEEFLQHLYRGGELLASGKVIEAKDFLEKAYALEPKNEKGQNLLGLACFKLGLFDRASEIYEALVRENPVDPTLRVNLGLVYLKTNGLDRAIREFETATDLAPDHKKAHNYLGLALAQAGDYGRARTHFIEAGSDAMAAKMEKALAGDAGPRQAAPPSEEKAPEFAELDSTDAAAGGGWGTERAESAEAAPAEQAELLPEVEPAGIEAPHEEMQIEVMSDEEAAPPLEAPAEVLVQTGPPAMAEALAEPLGGDWGAQFGFDPGAEARDAAAAAAAEPAPASDDMRLATDEGPMSVVPPAGFEALGGDAPTAPIQPPGLLESANVGALPAPGFEGLAQPEASSGMEAALAAATSAEPTYDAALAVASATSAAENEETVDEASTRAAVPPPAAEVSEDLQSEAAEAMVRMRAAADGKAGAKPTAVVAVATPAEAQAPAEVAGPGAGPALPDALGIAAPTLAGLASVGGLVRPVGFRGFLAGGRVAALEVRDELLLRLDGLIAMTGSLAFTPERKRFRGRATDQAFGAGNQQMMRAIGTGAVWVETGGRTFVSVAFAEESGYFREAVLFAFEEALAFENGRVPSEVPPDLELVHLSGKGLALLALEGPLKSLEVRPEWPVTVPIVHLVGWSGSLTPKIVPVAWDAGGKPSRTAVELSGEGVAMVSLPVG